MRSWSGRPTELPSPDVVVIGGGVIGCSIAYYLALAGVRVMVLERDGIASGASGVAAGMLAPQVEAFSDDAFFALTLRGRADHAPLADSLRDDVGLDVEYRATGVLRVARDEAERAELQRRWRWQSERGLRAEWLEPADLGRCEPLLAGMTGRLLAGGLWLPDEGQVRSPRLVQALAAASIKRGALFQEGTTVTGLKVSGERIEGVRTYAGVIAAETVVLAAGVWSGELARAAGVDLPIGPVKGQIMTLGSLQALPRTIIWSGDCYIAPKADGQIVLGATEEDGSYDRRPTLAGIGALATAALAFLPAVGPYTIEGVWAGLRPALPDRYPVVGRAPGLSNLLLATAHFRNGVLLGPLTGRAIAQLIGEGVVAPDLAPFGPERLRA